RAQRLLFAIAICLALLALGPPGARLGALAPAAAAETSREYLIKAAFLYNFAKFTEWPAGSFPDSAAPLDVCVFGEDPFGGALESIAGKTIRGRRVAVHRVASIEAAAACHLLFISDSEATRLAGILDSLRGRPVLTIAEMPGFSRSGGIINLTTNPDDRIRFEINVGIARRVGLRLSSKLLNLAEITPN
ncbi:MAG: YfiR family protein, partial [Proteobacteria bacterium]|nr:YfiR family protein [Pseudomonadota bacterium]